MTHSFVAYIDESGDDGLAKFRQPGAHGGATCFLIISATLIRQSRNLEVVTWRDQISSQMPEKKSRSIHFVDLNHAQRMMAVRHIAQLPLRGLGVISHKVGLEPGMYAEKNQLYFYTTRYLIERLSWLARDMRPSVPEGDGRVKIVFSRRGGMQYGEFRDYLRRLEGRADGDVRIHWPVIDIDAVDAQDHSRNAGLQIADCVASSIAAGFEHDRYGGCEPRYCEVLRPIIYHRRANYLSYGLKTVPHHGQIALSEEQMRTIRMFEHRER